MKSLKILIVLTVLFTSVPAFAIRKAAEPPAPRGAVTKKADATEKGTTKNESKGRQITTSVGSQIAGALWDFGALCFNGFMKGFSKPVPQHSPQGGESGSASSVTKFPGGEATLQCDHCSKTR